MSNWNSKPPTLPRKPFTNALTHTNLAGNNIYWNSANDQETKFQHKRNLLPIQYGVYIYIYIYNKPRLIPLNGVGHMNPIISLRSVLRQMQGTKNPTPSNHQKPYLCTNKSTTEHIPRQEIQNTTKHKQFHGSNEISYKIAYISNKPWQKQN